MPATKYPWESKTIVLNTVMALLGAATLFMPAASAWSQWVTANGAMIGTSWSVLNIVLRAVTKDKIVLGD